MTEVKIVMSYAKRRSNAELIEDCVQLGYLRADYLTLDPTYGKGTFWKRWRPDNLIACDLEAVKSPLGRSIDFTNLPWGGEHFDAVVFDPPYKLNGRPRNTDGRDERYGVHEYTSWQDRMALMHAGLTECCRVARRMLLVKCQDQVSSGKVRWQTVAFTNHVEQLGFGLVDRLDFPSYRPQPPGRSQRHARHNTSTLLIFQRGLTWRP